MLVSGVYLSGDYDKETGKNLNNLGYITQRIDNFLDDKKEAIENERINYQTEQALIAIGS
jgi:cell division protein FtsW (lipid II flippase)